MKISSHIFALVCMLPLTIACLGTEVGNGDKVPANHPQGGKDNVEPSNNTGNTKDSLSDQNMIVYALFAKCQGMIVKGSSISFNLDSYALAVNGSDKYSLSYLGNVINLAEFVGSDSTLTVKNAAGKTVDLTAQCSNVDSSTDAELTTKNFTITLENIQKRLEVEWIIHSTSGLTRIEIKQFDNSGSSSKLIRELVLD